MALRPSTLLLLFVMTFSTTTAVARNKAGSSIHLFGSFQYLIASSAADTISGAQYTKKFSHPLVVSGGLGIVLWNFLYLGARYEYWIGTREVTLAGSAQTDQLRYQSIAPEIGYYRANQRVILSLLASVHYPLVLQVESTGTTTATFQNSTTPFVYQARGLVGIKFSSLHAFFLEGGYRLANLGRFTSSGSDFIDSGGAQDFDLSGPFLGLGFLFVF